MSPAPFLIGETLRSRKGDLGRVVAYTGDLRQLWIVCGNRGFWTDASEWSRAAL